MREMAVSGMVLYKIHLSSCLVVLEINKQLISVSEKLECPNF